MSCCMCCWIYSLVSCPVRFNPAELNRFGALPIPDESERENPAAQCTYVSLSRIPLSGQEGDNAGRELPDSYSRPMQIQRKGKIHTNFCTLKRVDLIFELWTLDILESTSEFRWDNKEKLKFLSNLNYFKLTNFFRCFTSSFSLKPMIILIGKSKSRGIIWSCWGWIHRNSNEIGAHNRFYCG